MTLSQKIETLNSWFVELVSLNAWDEETTTGEAKKLQFIIGDMKAEPVLVFDDSGELRFIQKAAAE